MKRRDFK